MYGGRCGCGFGEASLVSLCPHCGYLVHDLLLGFRWAHMSGSHDEATRGTRRYTQQLSGQRKRVGVLGGYLRESCCHRQHKSTAYHAQFLVFASHMVTSSTLVALVAWYRHERQAPTGVTERQLLVRHPLANPLRVELPLD